MYLLAFGADILSWLENICYAELIFCIWFGFLCCLWFLLLFLCIGYLLTFSSWILLTVLYCFELILDYSMSFCVLLMASYPYSSILSDLILDLSVDFDFLWFLTLLYGDVSTTTSPYYSTFFSYASMISFYSFRMFSWISCCFLSLIWSICYFEIYCCLIFKSKSFDVNSESSRSLGDSNDLYFSLWSSWLLKKFSPLKYLPLSIWPSFSSFFKIR